MHARAADLSLFAGVATAVSANLNLLNGVLDAVAALAAIAASVGAAIYYFRNKGKE